MPKKAPIDWLKFVPLAVLIVTFVSGYTATQLRIANAEDKIKTQQDWLLKQSQDSGAIKLAQARTEEKSEAIYALVKEIKEDLRDAKRGR